MRAQRLLYSCLLLLVVRTVIYRAYTLQPRIPVTSKPGSLYCSGAGIYVWWQLGAAQYIKENCDMQYIRSMPTIGASAGSITATYLLLEEANIEALPYIALEVAREINLYDRSAGLAGVWGDILRKWLEVSLPENIELQPLANLYIALTPLIGSPKLVTNFESRKDLIDAIMASCHIPVVMNNKPFTEVHCV